VGVVASPPSPLLTPPPPPPPPPPPRLGFVCLFLLFCVGSHTVQSSKDPFPPLQGFSVPWTSQIKPICGPGYTRLPPLVTYPHTLTFFNPRTPPPSSSLYFFPKVFFPYGCGFALTLPLPRCSSVLARSYCLVCMVRPSKSLGRFLNSPPPPVMFRSLPGLSPFSCGLWGLRFYGPALWYFNGLPWTAYSFFWNAPYLSMVFTVFHRTRWSPLPVDLILTLSG